MEDFRTQLTALIDHMVQAGDQPLFLVVDLEGAAGIKAAHGADSLDSFKQAAIDTVAAATNGADAFTYGDEKLVIILSAGAYDRLKTFALIQKLRRALPLLGQSFDCFLRPECDVLEYDPATGAAALIHEITRPKKSPDQERTA